MNGNTHTPVSNGFEAEAPDNQRDNSVEYVGFRVDGRAVVLNLSEHRRLHPSRSPKLAYGNPSDFDWATLGKRSAQLAFSILLDYYNDEQIAREHHIAFRNRVISQLECDGPAACWHLTGEEIDASMATITDDPVTLDDGGTPSPTLPENWRMVSRPDRRVFQRADCDYYIVLGEGNDECLVVLCSQGDRAYPAPLASRTISNDADIERAIRNLVDESNDLIEPPDWGW